MSAMNVRLFNLSRISSLYRNSVTKTQDFYQIGRSMSVNVQSQHDSKNKLLNLNDTKTAYIAKSTPELLRAILVFGLCKSNFLVKNNRMIMDVSKRILGEKLFTKLMKMTFFGQFVAGEDEKDILPYVQRSRKYGVKAILDYSAEKDIRESEAVQKVKDSLKEVVKEPELRPDSAPKEFKTSIKFADRSQNVTSARTYFYESEAQCDKNMEIFINCIDAVSDSTKKEGLAAVKLTALGRPQFLLQMSDFLTEIQRLFELILPHPLHSKAGNSAELNNLDSERFQKRLEELGIKIDFDERSKWFTLLDVSGDGKIDLLDWSHLNNLERDYASIFRLVNKQTGKMEQLVPSLTDEGIFQLRSMIRRIDTIALHAQQKGVRVMIDAEQTYFQPAIRRLTMEMMRRFNRETAIIFNTYQCYLKEACNHIQTDMNMSAIEKFNFGAKLVRGAYMDQERSRAKELNYEDPVNPSYEATTRMYENTLDAALSEIASRSRGEVSIMIASHNEATVHYAIKKMLEHGIGPGDRVICFAQLLGMCDQISYNLSQNGYSVYKYVPYGPVNEVLPYLSRRAQENQSVLGGAQIERFLLKEEIIRRFKEGQLFYKP